MVALALAGCEAQSLPPVGSPPKPRLPSPADQFDPALGNDPRCRPTTGGDFAHRQYSKPLSVTEAELILVCTTHFAFGGMPLKRQGQAFNVLFEQPDSIGRFRSVAATAGPAGRLYAFAALQILAEPEAVGLAAELERDTRRVHFQDSDVISTSTVSDVVEFMRRRRIGEEFRRDRDALNDYFNKAG